MKKMTVDLDDAALLFIALSKKSKIAHSAKKYQQLSEELYKNKEFQNVINDFKLAHPEHYAPAL